jgi:putative tricarboxylic transport membrane protein
VALQLGPAEYFALSVLAFTTVAALLGASLARGLVQPVLGLALGLVGHRPAHRRRALLLRHPANC